MKKFRDIVIKVLNERIEDKYWSPSFRYLTIHQQLTDANNQESIIEAAKLIKTDKINKESNNESNNKNNNESKEKEIKQAILNLI